MANKMYTARVCDDDDDDNVPIIQQQLLLYPMGALRKQSTHTHAAADAATKMLFPYTRAHMV